MASTLHTHNLPSVPTYEKALNVWEKRRREYPRRAGGALDGDPLPLGTENQTSLSIRKGAWTQDIHIRYHSTDVVTFRPDGSVELIPYASRNTDLLVNAVMGLQLQVHYCDRPLGYGAIALPAHGLEVHRWDDAHVYSLSKTAARDRVQLVRTAAGTLTFADRERDTQPIGLPTINRKVSRALYAEYGLAPFSTWCKARRAMGGPPMTDYSADLYTLRTGARDRLRAVRDTAQWERLYHVCRDVVSTLRHDILTQHPEAVTWTEVPWIEGAAYQSVRAAQTKYRSTR